MLPQGSSITNHLTNAPHVSGDRSVHLHGGVTVHNHSSDVNVTEQTIAKAFKRAVRRGMIEQ
jgi:hypothetical protein